MRWRIRNGLGVAVVLLAPIVLAGCYEDVTPVNYEPGVYKGSDDPLRAKLRDGELHEELAQRVDRAFTDR
jgi:hypothetical protein